MTDRRFSEFSSIASMHSCMLKVMARLSVSDRLRAAGVNKFFRTVASDPSIWSRVAFNKVFVNDWEIAFAFMKTKGTRSIDLRHTLLPRPSELNLMWDDFIASIASVPTLEEIHMCPCDGTVVSRILKLFPDLKVFEAYEINSSSLSCEALASSTKMTEMVLNGLQILDDQQYFQALAIEDNLTTLTLTGIENIGDDIIKTIEKCHNLEILDLGKCDKIADDSWSSVLPGLKNLVKVRLEELEGSDYAYLHELSKLPDLKCLELINVKVKPGFKTAIRECKNISLFLIIPSYLQQAANTNTMVMETIVAMKSTLKYAAWGFTLEVIRATDLYMIHSDTLSNGPSNFLPAQHGKCVPITPKQTSESSKVALLYLNEIELLLSKEAPNTSINLFSCAHKNIGCQYLPQDMYRKFRKQATNAVP